jgi:signal transduction histidine kinase
VGESADDISEALRSLIVALAVTIPMAVAVLGGMVWWLVGRTLRAVQRIRREVDAIGPAELDRRVSAPCTADEIDDLAMTMNSMLARLEQSAERQRRLVSDASHDLRTPLTRMRSTLEVELTQPADRRTTQSLERAARSTLDELNGMQDLVDDLLLVARLDSGIAARDPALVDLDVIVDEEVRKLRPISPVELDMAAVSGATVLADRSQLARVVRNLLSNAVRHANARVAIRLVESDVVELNIDDDGPGIAPADRQRVFERFVRLDQARGNPDGGSGLGLSIANDLVTAHGGTISIGDSPIGGTRATVFLPTATPSPG